MSELAPTDISNLLDEIDVDNNGNISITGRGLCRLLGISSSSLAAREMSKGLAEKLTSQGFEPLGKSDPSFSHTEISIIIHYYSTAKKVNDVVRNTANAYLLTFATLGIKGFFQQAKGWNPEPQTPVPSLMQQMEVMVKGFARLNQYTSNKPGLANVITEAINNDSNLLPGMMTLPELLGSEWDNLTLPQRCGLGRMIAETFKSTYLSEPYTISRLVPTKDGRKVSRKFKVYPTDFLPQIKSCLTELLK